jgi:hypothetical protein
MAGSVTIVPGKRAVVDASFFKQTKAGAKPCSIVAAFFNRWPG